MAAISFVVAKKPNAADGQTNIVKDGLCDDPDDVPRQSFNEDEWVIVTPTRCSHTAFTVDWSGDVPAVVPISTPEPEIASQFGTESSQETAAPSH